MTIINSDSSEMMDTDCNVEELTGAGNVVSIFKDVLEKLPRCDNTPEFLKYFKNRKNFDTESSNVDSTDFHIDSDIDIDADTKFDETSLQKTINMFSSITIRMMTPTDIQQSLDVLSKLFNKPKITLGEIPAQFKSEKISYFSDLKKEIEESMYKEVLQFLVAKETRENGTFSDILEEVSKHKGLSDYIGDMTIPDWNLIFLKSKYAPSKLPYWSDNE